MQNNIGQHVFVHLPSRELDSLWSLNGGTKEEVNNAQLCESIRTKCPKVVWGGTSMSQYYPFPEMTPIQDRVSVRPNCQNSHLC